MNQQEEMKKLFLSSKMIIDLHSGLANPESKLIAAAIMVLASVMVKRDGVEK